ncbi:MAG: hypothetical protein M1828_001315 [Chrysothrix sp. TS-e1954]|nr:MAG: hypothetical protein M1828_001315 [Chrysothrix sp. TS-e1954]
MSDPHIDHVTEDEPAATWDILYPRRYFESFSKIYQAMCDGFISQLENHLGRQRKEVDVSSLWAKSGVSDTSLEDYLRTTLAHLQLHDCWQNNQLWLKKFRAKFGREPIADPLIRYKWQLGEAVTQDQYDAAVKERELFGSWFRTSVMADEGERLPATYNRLMLLPMLRSGQLNPTYRYEYPSRSFDEVARSRQGFGFDPDNLPILSGLPCINIPFDQISYHSDASGVTERLPVSISLVGPEGSDHALMRMARDFLKNAPQLQTKVKCGSKAF